ncbi:MAG: MBL fold metallo-hydrolase [Planctomycetes bacterium]|nr:MBL fold metallo-hydrolase [Planctomycetota bacterium]
MASPARRLGENAPGEFFVDDSCIDCDLCRGLAPEVVARDEGKGQSVVRRQPGTGEERARAAAALVSCPTASIGAAAPAGATAGAAGRGVARLALDTLPLEIAPDLYFCGFAARVSFGATAWLIRRPAGNVLVDSPRAAAPLIDRIEKLGGVRTLFLTHGDDVADHAQWRRRCGCERVLHRGDCDADTAGVERVLEGTAPLRLAEDLVAIPVPGHTRGSAALLWRDTYLFTGDHLAGNGEGRLEAWFDYCWCSWADQIRSMERLLDQEFTWVLPGHGRSYRASSAATMRMEVARVIAAMKRETVGVSG